MAYQTILAALASYKSVEYWELSDRLKGFTLVRVVIKDQVTYFAM